MQDWLKMTAGDLGRGIACGEIDAEALCDTYLAAINLHPLRDRIYSTVTERRARAEAAAAAARARAGQRRGPRDGVPISWKDLFDSAGVATEAGSALLKGRVPGRDAEVLRNATAAGLVCLGKTHMSELAFSGLGLNPVTATPPCVNDPDAVPGGSSSGAAASVAFGLGPAGSGRIPAARCVFRRRGTIWWGSRQPSGGCRARAWCRSVRASTRWGRWRVRSGMRHFCWRRWRVAGRRICAARRLKGCALPRCRRW
jgi:Asp-tRNA(Asn)/Glu-tRNA(Gln) amidotransferase A subunit family amidase